MALQAFEGALVVVSHDRHLLKTVADDLILIGDGKVQAFDGDLDDYSIWLKEQKILAKQSLKSENNQTEDPFSGHSKKEQRQQEAQRRKQLQPLKRKINQLEKRMETLQQRQSEIEITLADTAIYSADNSQKLQSLLKEKGQVDNDLDAVEMAWMEESEVYESELVLV